QIVSRTQPVDVAVIERTEWGPLIGTITGVQDGDRVIARGGAAWDEVRRRLPEAARQRAEIRHIERSDIGAINHRQEQAGLRLRRLELAAVTSGPEVEALQREMASLQARYKEEEARLATLRSRQTISVVVAADGGKEKVLPLAQVLSVHFPNQMSLVAKALHYVGNVWALLHDDPRESNTEGGVFPAIFGTVMMVLIMSLLVTPLG